MSAYTALLAALAERPKALGPHGGDHTRPPEKPADDLFAVRKEQPAIGSLKYGSNSTDYLTARIARDHPEIHERLKAGWRQK